VVRVTRPSSWRGHRAARWRGALAGLVLVLVIALLFAVGSTTSTPEEVAVSLGLVTLIAATAGWAAGPLAAGEPRRLLVAAFGYAIAAIAATVSLSIIQGIGDAIAAEGLAPMAVAVAIFGRATYALAGTAYLIVPALVAGMAWSIAARGLDRLVGSRSG
jgi:hypothetical protein